MYNKYQITQLDPRSALTEVFYHIACSRERGEELVCLRYTYSDEKALRRVLLNTLKALKEYRREGKISLFISYDTLFDNTTEAKYLFNKYPPLEEDLFLKNPDVPFILVRL